MDNFFPSFIQPQVALISNYVGFEQMMFYTMFQECSKKQKNDDPQNAIADVLNSNDDNKEVNSF